MVRPARQDGRVAVVVRGDRDGTHVLERGRLGRRAVDVEDVPPLAGHGDAVDEPGGHSGGFLPLPGGVEARHAFDCLAT